MDFDEALARTVNLLERQGFATYRTLKRRFHFDDATLEALTTAPRRHPAPGHGRRRHAPGVAGRSAPRHRPHPPR